MNREKELMNFTVPSKARKVRFTVIILYISFIICIISLPCQNSKYDQVQKNLMQRRDQSFEQGHKYLPAIIQHGDSQHHYC